MFSLVLVLLLLEVVVKVVVEELDDKVHQLLLQARGLRQLYHLLARQVKRLDDTSLDLLHQ